MGTERDREIAEAEKHNISYWNQLAAKAVTDADALTELYEHFFPRVYNFVYGRLKQAAQADDVVSETFVKALAHLEDYNADKGAFSTWLFRIASNNLVSSLRGAPQREAAWEDFFDPAANEHEQPDKKLLEQEGNTELLQALDSLDERERKAVELKYWGELGNKEIAEALGITASNAGVILHRAINKLKKFFPEE